MDIKPKNKNMSTLEDYPTNTPPSTRPGSQPPKGRRWAAFVRLMQDHKTLLLCIAAALIAVAAIGIVVGLYFTRHAAPRQVTTDVTQKPVAPTTPTSSTPAPTTPTPATPEPTKSTGSGTSKAGGGNTGTGGTSGGSSSGTSGGTTTGCPAWPAHPDASCTGIPSGTTLGAWTGDTSGVDSTSDRTYDSISLPVPSAGFWTFSGNNLTFKNCKINGGVVFTGHNIDVEHCDIPAGVSLSGTVGVTMLYNNIHGWDDGVHITSDSGPVSNVTLMHNFIHDPAPSCADHSDGIQLLGINGFTASYNTIDLGPPITTCDPNDPVGSDPLNGAFQIESTQGPDLNLTITNNYLNGGGYTARFYACSNTVFTGNRFGRSYFYGPVDNQDDGCFTSKTGNVYDDNGQAITF